jgi:3-oxoacyl-[acyl-carrier-protein] synthase-3
MRVCGIRQDEHFKQSDGVGRDFLKIDAGGSIPPATAETVQDNKYSIIQDGKQYFKYAVTHG